MRKEISLINAIRVSEFLVFLLCIMRNGLGDSKSFGRSIPNKFYCGSLESKTFIGSILETSIE